jgi:plastocyanin
LVVGFGPCHVVNSCHSALGGELRGTVRIVSDAATMQSSVLDPYAGTLNSAGSNPPHAMRGGTHTARRGGLSRRAQRAHLAATRRGQTAARQINQSFEPHVLGVPVGTTVDFPNGDLVYHNVFSYSKTKKFDLGYLREGQVQDVTFDKPGIVQVFCDIHSTMSAYVLVVDSPYVTQPDDSGAYEFPSYRTGPTCCACGTRTSATDR